MSEKPEESSEASFPYLALNAVAQYIQMTNGISATCSVSQKAEILELMERLIDLVTEVLAESWEQSKQTNGNDN